MDIVQSREHVPSITEFLASSNPPEVLKHTCKVSTKETEAEHPLTHKILLLLLRKVQEVEWHSPKETLV